MHWHYQQQQRSCFILGSERICVCVTCLGRPAHGKLRRMLVRTLLEPTPPRGFHTPPSGTRARGLRGGAVLGCWVFFDAGFMQAQFCQTGLHTVQESTAHNFQAPRAGYGAQIFRSTEWVRLYTIGAHTMHAWVSSTCWECNAAQSAS